MNNSVYGKTIKKKISLRLLYNAKNYEPHKNDFWGEKEAKRLFQELSFYNTFIEKRHIKCLNNIDLLHELPFHDELNIEKISKALEAFARSYRIEMIDSKDPSVQLIASRTSIKDLFDELKKALNIK